MKSTALALVVLVSTLGGTSWAARSVPPLELPKVELLAKLPLSWQKNVKEALALARTQYQPVLVLFSSPDCPWCARLKEEVLTEPGVTELLQHFSLVEIDTSQDPDSAAMYQVRGLPTILILSADGEVRTGAGGYLPAPDLQKLLRGALNPELLKRKEASSLELLKMLEDNNVPTKRWPEIMIELGTPERRKDLHARIFNLAPFPRQPVVDLLEDPRLAVRLGALEIVEELTGDTSGYDPWLDDSAADTNKAALAKLQAWAGGDTNAPAGAVTSTYSALTREQVVTYIQDLTSDDHDRSVRALRMLEHGGPNVFQVLTDFLQTHPDLPPGMRNRIKEVQYMLSIAGSAGGDASALAHRLLFGTLDVRLKAIGDLHGAGRSAIPVLKEFLADRDPLVRETAADSLLIAGGAQAIPVLKDHLTREKDKDVIFCILNGLGKVRNRGGLDILISYLTHANEDLVVAALNSIAKLRTATVHADVAKSLSDPRWRVRAAALDAVGALKLNNLDSAVTELLKDKDAFVRYSAVKTLTSISAKKAAPRLEEAFLREDELKGAVVAAFGSMDMALPASFSKAIEGKSPDVVLSVIEALKDCGEKDLTLAIGFLDDENLDVACAAVRLIASKGMKNSKCRARIIATLRSGKRDLVLAALESAKIDDRDVLMKNLMQVSGAAVPGEVVRSSTAATTLDALLGAFEAAVSDTSSTPPKPAATVPGATRSEEEDVFAAFEEPATAQLATVDAGTGVVARAEAGDSMDDLVRAVQDAMGTATDDHIRFRAALLLTQLGDSKGLPVLASGLSSRTQADRMAVAQGLSRSSNTDTLSVLQQLLRDPSEEVRGATAAVCLEKTMGTSFAEAVLNELSRPDSPLKPVDVPLNSFERVARQGNVKRIAGDWARSVLAESKDTLLQNFALVVLENCWKTSDLKLVAKRLHVDDPWQRRAALHALGKGDLRSFTNELAWACEDPSEYVRAVIPNIYTRGSVQWLDYLDKTHFQSERYFYSSSYSSYGDEPKLAPEARQALVRLTTDESAAVRAEAFFCLLSNRETVDLIQFLKTVESFPDQQVIGERVADYLVSNYEQLGRGFRVLIPFLEKSRRDDTYLDKVRTHFKVDPTQAQETFSVITRTEESVPATFVTPSAGETARKPVHKLVYFTTAGCQDCERVQRLLLLLKQDFPDLDIEMLNIRKLAAMQMNEALCERYRVPEGSRLVAPAVFAGGGYLIKRDITDGSLHELVIRSEGIPLSDWYEIPPESLTRAETAISRRYSAMGVGMVALAGLLDGVNPCAFATIIFLLSYLQIARRQPREILQVGAAFILAVFLAYFAMGLGLIGVVVKAQKVLSGLRQALNWGLAAFSLVIMVLSVRDGVLCMRGRLQDIALQLPGVLKTGIHGVIRRGSRHPHFVIAAFVIGVVISILELACTGQVYLPTIAYMLEKGGNAASATGYLLLYNILFVLPLVVIFVIACFGLTSDRLTRFLQKHAVVVKFATALLFLLLFLFFVFGDQIHIGATQS